jgi:hypothetical protein
MKEKGHRDGFLSFVRLAGLHRKYCASNLWLLICDFGGRLAAAALAFFLVPSTLGAAGSFQPRVRIPSIVEVQGETIRLADLLPPGAPTELGQIGARIVLGDSPLPASQRIFSKNQIELQLREYPSILEELELPQRLIIRCKQRRLSADEIRTAIESFLDAEGLPNLRTPNQDALNFQAPVFVTKDDPGLKVIRLEPDRVRRQVRFLLWTSKEPQVLPFYVTAEALPKSPARESLIPLEVGPEANPRGNLERLWKAEAEGLAALQRGGRYGVVGQKAALGLQLALPPVLLVMRGKAAKLVLETQSLRMTALVTPLESGSKGQIIRVKNPDTQRVFRAEVVGAGLLAAALAGE